MRAIAVSLVVLFHLGLGVRGGFIGVDIFFVISGYLITSILHREVGASHKTLLAFWSRRCRRILPAMAVMLLFVASFGYFLFLPNDLVDLGQSLIWHSGMQSNHYFWRSTGYFQAPALSKPLLHMWSLAIEEQFYIFLPLLVLMMSKASQGFRRTVYVVLATISCGLCIYGTQFHPSAAFYLLPTRAWELLVGSVVSTLGGLEE